MVLRDLEHILVAELAVRVGLVVDEHVTAPGARCRDEGVHAGLDELVALRRDVVAEMSGRDDASVGQGVGAEGDDGQAVARDEAELGAGERVVVEGRDELRAECAGCAVRGK